MYSQSNNFSNVHSDFMEHWLFDQRNLWPGQFRTRKQFELMQKMEEQLNGMEGRPIMQKYLEKVTEVTRNVLGIKYEVIEVNGYNRNYKVIIPYSDGLMSIIRQNPTTVVQFGDRKAGKTVGVWTMAWEEYNSLKETEEGVEIYFMGEADAITNSLKNYASSLHSTNEIRKFSDHIIKRRTAELPEFTGKNQIDIFNEITETTSSYKGMLNDAIEIALHSERVRHEGRWMFFNAPRIPALNINFRESPNQLFYHLTKDNMKYAEEMVRDPWKPIIYLTSMLKIGQSLSIYSLLPYKDPEDPDRTYTTAIDFFEPRPPAWLLDVIEGAKAIELKHLGEVQFMRRDDARRKWTVPDKDVIQEEKFVFRLKDAMNSGKFPGADWNAVYGAIVDWKQMGLSKRKACEANKISMNTLITLEKKRFLQIFD